MATLPGADAAIGSHGWKDLLGGMQESIDSSILIVTSLHADERLWAKALNLGPVMK